MNVNMLIQGLAAEIVRAAQSDALTEPGQEGAEFEAMLREQSKAAGTQKKDPAKDQKTTKKDEGQEKQETEESQKNSTKGQETTEKGQEVAAALVTSQPVVPFELVAGAGENTAAGGLEGAVQSPVLTDAAVWVEDAPVRTEEVQPGLVQEAQPQTQESLGEMGALPQTQVLPLPENQEVQEQPMLQPEGPELPEAVQPVETKEQAIAFTQVQPEGGEPRRTEEEGQVTDASVGAQPLFQRETATPVKVADPEPVYAEEPEAPQQLAAKLSQALERGDSMVQLQLTPESLGKLTVEITRTAQGLLSVVLTPETAKAASLLQQHSGSLLSALMGDGREAEIIVQQPQQPETPNQFLNPDGQNRQQHQQQQQQHRPKGTTEDFLQQLRLGLVDAGAQVD